MISYDRSNGNNGNGGSSNSRNTGISADSKKLHIFRQNASAVSHALWPSDLQRSRAIEKAVQKRRYVKFRNMPLSSWLTQNIQESLPVLLVVISTIVGGSIATALFLHLWYVLLIPIIFLTLTTLAIVQSFMSKLHHTPRQTLQATPRYFKSSPGILSTRRTPETPIPHTPLVRELETFDLSQTGVEHFLDVTP